LFIPKDKIVLKLEMFIDVNKDWTKKFLHIYCVHHPNRHDHMEFYLRRMEPWLLGFCLFH
jgi:hypothetical protein